MTKNKVMTGVCMLALSGCLGIATEEDAQSASLVDLCRTVHWTNHGFANGNADLAIAELERRNVFSQADLRGISSGAPFIGMSEDALTCSYGGFLRVNETLTAGTVSRQYIWGDIPNSVYFYTDGLKVVAIQA